MVPIFAGEDTPHPDPSSPFADVGTNVHLEQLKDMLLTYNEYNRDLGYVQGMSDLLAPIYAVMQDDAAAFWGFQHFMERMERNFLRDQSGMRSQLLTLDHLVQLMDPKLYLHLQSADSTNFFFFFRMLLVWYKREFAWLDILHLWEVLWTDYLSSGFHLFVALAILEKHRGVIMEHLKHFDEVLKYSKSSFSTQIKLVLTHGTVNELSTTIDLEQTLVRAEALFRRFQRTVEAIDKKSNFPAPALRHRTLGRNASTGSVQSFSSAVSSPGRPTSSSSSTQPRASTSGTDTVSATHTNSGPTTSHPKSETIDKGKRKSSDTTSPTANTATSIAGPSPSAGGEEEMVDQRPKVISPELRALLSRKVEILPRKVVRKEGDGVGNLLKKPGKVVLKK